MRRLIQIASLILGAATLTGCASAKAYFVDRGRDAADVFTATAGVGGGAKVRVGPAQVGLLASWDVAGLRGGRVANWWARDATTHNEFCGPSDGDFFVFPLWGFGMETFHMYNGEF